MFGTREKWGKMITTTIPPGSTRMCNERGFPMIGYDVFIEVGAQALGNIRVGNGAMIGANPVVIHDLPAGTTAVGVPVLQIQRKNSHGESCNAV